jgi:hypothetical protein
MYDFLSDPRFDFISTPDKEFILAFDEAIERLGYGLRDKIGSGYCWGKYMLIYTKVGVKSKNVYARIYIRDTSIVLRLFLNGVDKRRLFIENAPAHIKEVFLEGYGDCKHDKNEKDGKCMFRKTYAIDGRLIEKCNGNTFEFPNPSVEKIGDYMALFTEFYPQKKKSPVTP